MSEQCGRPLPHASSTEQQGGMMHFAVDDRGAELQELHAASSLTAGDRMPEVLHHSNLHSSVCLATSDLGCDDLDSTAHHSGCISVCMGDTWEDAHDERLVTECAGAHDPLKDRPRSREIKGCSEYSPLQYDAGLRMAMALQAEPHGGMQSEARLHASVKLRKSKPFVTDNKMHSRHFGWRQK
jgi:hypothetical protein